MTKARPNIVVLDGYTLNPGDLSWNKLRALGHLTIYEHSSPEQLLERCQHADLLLPNKAVIDRSLIEQLPQLKCICVTATGYNNVDVKAAAEHNIPVCNVAGYSTDSVPQHVFALLLALTNQAEAHNESVAAGQWAACRDFTYQLRPIVELAGKTMGIYGFGRIGQRLANIAQAFGMNILATHKHPKRDAREGVQFVTLEDLFRKSDVISLHAPLSASNKEIINASLFSLMKPTAYLINTARGPLMNELDLKQALEAGHLAGAGLDVLSSEPPPADHPLIGLKNCIITPHNAWASKEARERLMDWTVENVRAFLRGAPRNVVND